MPDTPEYPSRKVASHPIAERLRQSTQRSNIVRGLADFVIFSFLCDVRYRIAFVENRTDGQHVLPDVISLLDGTDGYLLSFDDLEISRHLIEQRFSNRNRQFAFIDIEDWSVCLDNYDFVGPSPDQRLILVRQAVEMREREGLHLCLEMSIAEVNTHLLSILPLATVVPIRRKHTYSQVEAREVLLNASKFIEEVGTDWVTKIFLRERFAPDWKVDWWETEIQTELRIKFKDLSRKGRRLPIPKKYSNS